MIHKLCLVAVILYIFSAGTNLAEPVRLATTTSTDNSGLIKALLPHFEKKTGNQGIIYLATPESACLFSDFFPKFWEFFATFSMFSQDF